ncbi:biopolymer transporter ExbD [Candidatus Uabimicrobium sp. HlEnr_7]|uniref:biopolymer transporter ExbD n=1 Tax=Candidatus Uabimicrobium helgolandensis TaxID=3095367 RepID=UPI0035583F86
MKKPDIGKRILPLLDIVFILLAFFIVLPHGVKSNEIVKIGMLEKQKNELQQELEYFRWKHGTNKALSNKIHRILNLVFKNNKIFIGKDNILLSKDNWTDLLAKKIEVSEATFIIFRVEKDDDGSTTRTKSIDGLKKFLQQQNIIYIEEDSGNDDW